MARWFACMSGLVAGLSLASAHADEGMWLLNNFPSERWGSFTASSPARHGSTTCACLRCGWRRAARRASSPRTASCRPTITARSIASNSSRTPPRTLSPPGFYAKEEKDEVKCPAHEIDQLIEIGDVTQRVQAALARQGGSRFRGSQARRERKHSGGMLAWRSGAALRCRVALQWRRLQSL